MLRVTSTKSNVTVAGFIVGAPLVTRDVNIFDAARLMLPQKSMILPVVESAENAKLIGVVSLLDIFRGMDLEKVPERQISEVMTKKVVTATPDEPVSKVWENMIDSDFTGLPVLDEKDEPMGMITRFDILKRGFARISREDDGKTKDGTKLHIGKIMSTPIYSIRPEDTLRTAFEAMKKNDIGRIAVVDNGKLVGIVDRYDLIKSYLGDRR
jgi:CBS domain-containing protein